MGTKKLAAKATAKSRRPADLDARLFERELAGELGPSRDLMAELFRQSNDFSARTPWRRLSDSDLVLFKDPDLGEMCYCCVMGTLGQVFAFQVFVGDEGYQVYRAIATGDPGIADSLYALGRGVYVEFEERTGLTPPDREAMRSVGIPLKAGARIPLFRAQRPGYHPWYPSEAEARLLSHCLAAVTVVLDRLDAEPAAPFWTEARVYPQVIAKGGEGHYKIQQTRLPQRIQPVLEMPNIDEKRVAAIVKSGLPVRGVLELDTIHSRASVGKKHERKASLSLALAIDGTTAFAFPPTLNAPGQPVAGLLPAVLLNAIETSQSIPAEVHVRHRDQKHMLDRLARELGFRLKATESLPAFDFAKEHLLQLMHGLG